MTDKYRCRICAAKNDTQSELHAMKMYEQRELKNSKAQEEEERRETGVS